MMQLVTSVVARIGLSVASYLNNKSPPVTVRTRERKDGIVLDLSSDSESDDTVKNANIRKKDVVLIKLLYVTFKLYRQLG